MNPFKELKEHARLEKKFKPKKASALNSFARKKAGRKNKAFDMINNTVNKNNKKFKPKIRAKKTTKFKAFKSSRTGKRPKQPDFFSDVDFKL